jgi:hypothetical protein
MKIDPTISAQLARFWPTRMAIWPAECLANPILIPHNPPSREVRPFPMSRHQHLWPDCSSCPPDPTIADHVHTLVGVVVYVEASGKRSERR